METTPEDGGVTGGVRYHLTAASRLLVEDEDRSSGQWPRMPVAAHPPVHDTDPFYDDNTAQDKLPNTLHYYLSTDTQHFRRIP